MRNEDPILDRILADKRREIAERRMKEPLPETPTAGPDFIAALRSVPMGLIAEVKRKSPSAGVIRDPFRPDNIARAYARAGAQAISTLVDGPYFGGGDADFRAVRAAVKLPMLYKEFIVDAWQIRHAASLGASAALLIVAALSPEELARLIACCERLGLVPLVETHSEEEMRVAAGLNCRCIGINNRDLKTFSTSIKTTFRLARLAPPGCTLISESGIRCREDVDLVRQAGAHAVLVGEHLLRSRDLEQAARNLMGRA